MSLDELINYQKEIEAKSPQEVISWAIAHFGPANIALSSSLGAEDQVLIDMLMKINKEISVFTLDTGRLPQETYDAIEETRKHYNKKIEILFPEKKEVEEMVNKYGPNLFYQSITNRTLCCDIRKVRPLRQKLSSLKAWICGLRRDQAATRKDLKVIEWDGQFGLYKINPLVEWSEKQVWDYIHQHKVPYNKLHDQGYPSIGCACCTRAVNPEEDIRAGRWWWEKPEQKECGLHDNKNCN